MTTSVKHTNKFKKLRKQALAITKGLVETAYRVTRKAQSSPFFSGQVVLQSQCTRAVYQHLKAG